MKVISTMSPTGAFGDDIFGPVGYVHDNAILLPKKAVSGPSRFLAALLLSACTDLFFRPGKVLIKRPEVRALAPVDVAFSSSDGTRLHGWSAGVV